jgi:hypothetical protein
VRRLLAAMTALAGLLMISPAAHAASMAADFGARETPDLKVGFLHNLSVYAPTDGAVAAAAADRLALQRGFSAGGPAWARREPHDRAVGPLVLPGPRVAAGRPVLEPASSGLRPGRGNSPSATRAAASYWDIWNGPRLEILGRHPRAVLRDIRRRGRDTARGIGRGGPDRRAEHDQVAAQLDRGIG